LNFGLARSLSLSNIVSLLAFLFPFHLADIYIYMCVCVCAWYVYVCVCWSNTNIVVFAVLVVVIYIFIYSKSRSFLCLFENPYYLFYLIVFILWKLDLKSLHTFFSYINTYKKKVINYYT
jgi:hypothetical protein